MFVWEAVASRAVGGRYVIQRKLDGYDVEYHRGSRGKDWRWWDVGTAKSEPEARLLAQIDNERRASSCPQHVNTAI